MRSSLTFVALFVLCPSALLEADKTDWNGYWWASMTPSFKLGWVTGYAKAMDLAGTAFGGTYLRFELYEGGHVVGSFDFKGDSLMTRFEDGVHKVIGQVSADLNF